MVDLRNLIEQAVKAEFARQINLSQGQGITVQGGWPSFTIARAFPRPEPAPAAVDESCNCSDVGNPFNTVTLAGITEVFDGLTGNSIPLDSISINGSYTSGTFEADFGSWESHDDEGSYYGTFNLTINCDETEDFYIIVIGVNSGDGSGSMGNGYTTGQATAMQVFPCRLVDGEALSSEFFTGTITFEDV